MITSLTANPELCFRVIGYMAPVTAPLLPESGYNLTACNRDRAQAEALVGHGAIVAKSITDLASNTDVILSCVANDDAVRTVYTGPEGVFANVRPGSVVIEMSTVNPDTSRELDKLGAARAVSVLDVPISGSTAAAEQGTLTLFGGGDEKIFDNAEPIFRAVARQYLYLGPSGSGTTMKLVANTLLGVGMQAISEAVVLGQKAGLDRDRLFDVLSHTAVIAPAHAGKLAKAVRNDYAPQFAIRLMNKDFGLILEAAARMQVPMPVTAAAFQINAIEAASNNEKDFSAVIREMENLARLN